MKANVNFEFGSEELEAFATGVLSKGILKAFGEADPAQLQIMLAGLHHGLGMVLSQAAALMQNRSPQGRVMHPQTYGGPMGPGPYGPMGPPPSTGPMPYGAGPVGPADPSNARPVREPATVDRCFAIEATRNTEAGWGCHGCATFNGTQRTVCRYCGHTRCDAIVTPPPEPGLTPEPAP